MKMTWPPDISIRPYYSDATVAIYYGDCLKVLPLLKDVTAVVTDPPYGLGFMGQDWDYGSPGKRFWELIAASAFPGSPLLSFGGTRTYHRLVSAIEDAGWEIRDCLMWLYGSGFPKNLDIGKVVDKWDGWGTALKPAYEPIVLARKPLNGTTAHNVQKYGTGALWIDGSRVEIFPNDDIHAKNPHTMDGFGHSEASVYGDSKGAGTYKPPQGRWPANVIHDGSDEVTNSFPISEVSGSAKNGTRSSGHSVGLFGNRSQGTLHNDDGSACRFFYTAKASKSERNAGMEGLNDHPTVKPLALMRYLITLITQRQRNLILDPFMGSGTTLRAAKDLGLKAIGIEVDERYCRIAVERMAEMTMSFGEGSNDAS